MQLGARVQRGDEQQQAQQERLAHPRDAPMMTETNISVIGDHPAALVGAERHRR